MKNFSCRFLRYIILIIAISLIASVACAATSEELFKKGQQALKAGKTDEAEAHFLAIEKIDPLNLKTAYALALIYRDRYIETRHGYLKAKEQFTNLDYQLRAHPPGIAERSLYLGFLDFADLLLHGTENQLALAYIDRFLEAWPDYYEMEKVQNARGVALFRLNRYDDASAAFRAAMKENPDFLAPRVNLRGLFLRVNAYEEARVAHRLGHNVEALALVDELLLIASGFTPAMRLRGDILRDMGRGPEALVVYGAVLASDPDDPITHGVRLEMASLLEKSGDLKGALNMLNANASRFRKVENDPTRAEIIRLVKILRAQQ